MDPFVQLVKDLLESSDPHIKVVDCLPDRDPASAKSGPGFALKPLDPENPPENLPENPQDLPGGKPK
jgi:hypothetical protein